MGNERLPVGPARKHIAAFERLGWSQARSNGSHVMMTKTGCRATLAIPNHKGKDVRRGLLGQLLIAAGVSADEYLDAYK